ncbi:MAG: helix-turn-helix domain-containing protein [Bacillota bacterium]
MQWLKGHYMEELHLEHLYLLETGSSITDYVMARRIKEVCHILETTTLPIKLICSKVGLNNPSYFIHKFKKFVGILL